MLNTAESLQNKSFCDPCDYSASLQDGTSSITSQIVVQQEVGKSANEAISIKVLGEIKDQ